MKWFNNMKIGTRLLAGFLIVALIAGGIGVLGVVNIRKIDKLDTELYEKMTAPLGELITLAEVYQRMRGNIRDIIISSTEAEFTDYEGRIKERNTEFNKAIDLFSQTILTEEGEQMVADLKSLKVKYDQMTAQIITLARENKDVEALALLRGDGEKTAKEVEAVLDKIVSTKIKLAKEAAESNVRTANSSTLITIILLIVGMAVSIFLGSFISASINSAVRKLVAAAVEISEGNLGVVINADTKDEIGILAGTLKKMAANLNEVMSNINTAAEQVASGARQVSDSSMALSQGATEQASSIEQLTASLEEIASQTKQNAESANQANSLAEMAKGNAIEGNGQMKDMLKAMEEINDSSSNISKIIKVIDEIAFQTNILALNAAVEAARAGQHGKGFAVVAEEVRNLAARSANAAKETTDMIEGSIKKVESGTKIANETAVALTKIVGDISKVANLVGDIAAASNEQATGIAQVNQGIMQVSTVVQTNSATSEEGAAASEELSSQAELLKEQVSRFKLRSSNSSVRTYKGMEEISPEVLRMLEQMNDRRKSSSAADVYTEAKAVGSKKIALSDREFGKY